MLVAARSFLADDPISGELRFVADVTHVSDDYWLAKAMPECFRSAVDGVRVRSRGAASLVERPLVGAAAVTTTGVKLVSERRDLERWRLIGGAPGISLNARANPSGSLRLTESASAAISAEILIGGSLETGGVLLGRSDAALADIVGATGPGVGADRRRSALKLDLDDLEREAERRGSAICGVWHSHPTAHKLNHLPSPADLTAFDAWRARAGLSSFAAVVATPARSEGWTLSAWILSGRCCRPTKIWEIHNE